MNISVYHKHVQRNILWIFLLIIFFVIGITTGKAWASEPTAKLSVIAPERPSKRPEIKILPSITTTTTTTLKPKPRPQTIATTKTIPAPKSDWIPQCKIWMTQADIPSEVHDTAIVLISRESSCNPTARNPNSSAGGIPQALPWTKMGCTLDIQSAVCQLRWMDSYVKARYGSWDGALSHSHSKGWY